MRYMVCRYRVMAPILRVKVLAYEPEEHGVLPLAVPQVRLPLHALADEARALRVAERALVEGVDLELEPVQAEVDEQVPLELPGGVVRDSATAEVRVDGEPAQARDPRPGVRQLEAHRAR